VEQQMFGPYRLDALLGRGGMGEVHRAFDTRRGREVALKLLLESFSADEQFRTRFQREAEITATLRDPHVIPIHDFGEVEGRLFLDMRLVDGADLGSVLARAGALSAERAVRIVGQVAGALAAAHAGGLIHRDVKPSNILVTGEEDFCYLVDFGIAHTATTSTRSRLTATGTTLGTFAYMAPERFLEEAVDHTVDVYALACVLHECLTGQRPFPSDQPAILLNAHLNKPPPRPSEQVSGVPVGLDDVVARGMAKQPADRYPGTRELAAAARSALAPGGGAVAVVTAGAAQPAAGPGVAEPGAPAATRPVTAPEPTVGSAPDSTVVRPAPADDAPDPSRGRRRRWLLPLAALVVTGIVATVSAVGGPRQPEVLAPPPTIEEAVLTDGTSILEDVAIADLDGQPIAVTPSGATLLIWNLRTRQQIGPPLTGHATYVNEVATAVLDGKPIAVSASNDDTLRIWDLRAHQQIGPPLSGHNSWANGVATAVLDGQPIAVSGGFDDTLRIWDLRTGQQIGQPLTGHTSGVLGVSTALLDGRPIAVSASGNPDFTLRVWDLRTHRQLGEPLEGHTAVVNAVTTAVLDGQPIAISEDHDDQMRIWDLRTHRQLGRPLTGYYRVATIVLDGQPLAVSASSSDNSLRIWDLRTHEELGQPLTGHTSSVSGIATAVIDGKPFVISSSRDKTLRIWDLTKRAGK
jgi:serine/threonine-protein kinase